MTRFALLAGLAAYAKAEAISDLAELVSLTGSHFYQFIDYDALYGEGGILCYKLTVGVALIAVQNTCGLTCCRRAEFGGTDGFQNGVDNFANALVTNPSQVTDEQGEYPYHNYVSDVTPGPWLVARLDRFATNDGSIGGYGQPMVSTCDCDPLDSGSPRTILGPCPCGTEANRATNYGTGEWDVFPCPRTQNLDPTQAGKICNPSDCFAAGGDTGGKYPSEVFGCEECDVAARVAYTFFEHGQQGSLELEVYHTVQRWESIATNNAVSRTVTGSNYQACYYLANVKLVDPLPPPSPSPSPPPIVTARKDPHLHFAHGGRADLRGEDGAVFNFLSARNVSFNVKTEAADFKWAHRVVHGTRLSAVYWTIRTDANHILEIEYEAVIADRAIVRNLNDTQSAADHDRKRSADFVLRMTTGKMAAYRNTYWLDNVFVKFADRVLTVTVQDMWRMTVKQSAFPFAKLNLRKTLLDISAQALYDADHDVVAPHGLFGQSYDGDDVAVNGKIDKRLGDEMTTEAQAEGAIEGIFTDYKITPTNPFSTAFKYSRFDSLAAEPRNISKLSGTQHNRTVPMGYVATSADDMPQSQPWDWAVPRDLQKHELG